MSIQTKVISRKLISIIVAAMFFMAAAIAIVIGISGYANLESITRANNERAANVISKQIEADVRRSAEVLTSMELSVELNNLMVLLSLDLEKINGQIWEIHTILMLYSLLLVMEFGLIRRQFRA